MRLLQLTTENFMSLQGVQALNLQDVGLAHICGLNEDDPGNDSNASGKTTILEALTWGLFGEGLPRAEGNSEQGVRADEVLNDKLKKQCRVIVHLEDEDHNQYAVFRWRKWKENGKGRASNGATLEVNGRPTEALDIDETNQLITEKIGITREIWCRGVIFGQESKFNFCEATASRRSEILTTIEGIQKIDDWIRKCRDERVFINREITEVGGRVAVSKMTLERVLAQDPSSKIESWEQQRQARLQAARSQLMGVEQRGHGLKAQLDKHGVFNEVPPPQIQDFEKSYQAELDQKQNDHTQKFAEFSQLQSGLFKIDQEINSIETLQPGSQCPTCFQVITIEHQNNCLGVAKTKKIKIADKLKYSQVELQVHEKDLAQAKYRLQEVRQAKEAYRQRIQAYEYRKLKFENEKDRIEQELKFARQEWNDLTAEIIRIANETNPFQQLAAEHQAQTIQIQSDIEHYEQRIKELQLNLGVCNWWDVEFPKLKLWIFDSIVDTLAAEANRWLNIMTGGVIWVQITTEVKKKKKTQDEIGVQIYRWNPDGTITTRPYRIWSGGEKRRVALAVDFGLSQLMAHRASKSYRFLSVDEIDRHLDQKGREGLRAVLDEMRSEKETCLVITHDPEFQASFDREIKVRKKNSASVIEVSHEVSEAQAN